MTGVLVIFTQAPYSNASGQEGLDAALSAAAMDRQVSLLFIDDGVFQIRKNQAAAEFGFKEFTRTFKAVGDFGIESLYVEQQALSARGLSADDLIVPTAAVDHARAGELIAEHTQVMVF